MSLDELPSISSEIVVLAVIWDEINGPSIVSKAPAEGLADPVTVALQIYLSSVAVFGQHGQTKRIDFSLPLLSVSPNHLVYVAFDAWPDEEVRGDERPFFLGFIMERETNKIVSEFLSTNIWRYMDNLKINKVDYNVQPVYEEIMSKLHAEKSASTSMKGYFETSKDEVLDYTTIQALQDLETTSELWTKYKDRSVLNNVLKAAYKLTLEEDPAAGNAYFLAGSVFFHSGDYDNALKSYDKASERFKSADDLQNSAESMFNVAICAYRLEKFEMAKKNLLASGEFIEDTARKARMNLYLAQTHFRLTEFEHSSQSFEVAAENAIKAEDTELVGQILSIYASRLQERADSTKNIEDSLRHSLYEHSAKQRQRAADYFIEKEMNAEAGTSLVLASKSFQVLLNIPKAIETLEIASEMYIKDLDYSSAGRALLDVINLYKKLKDVKSSDLVDIYDKTIDVIEKIEDTSNKMPLLIRAYREKTKFFESNGNLIQARSCYEEIIKKGEENESSPELLSIRVAFGNFLFQLEDYRVAGKLFYQSYQNMDTKNAQAQKLLKNANISYKRACTSYLQAINIHLHQKKYEEALKLYSVTFDLLRLVLTSSPETEKETNNKWVQQTIKGIRIKKNLLPMEERKLINQKLKEFISVKNE
ncbi:MAG: tetratricopeptide repeat protein [Candidatus Hodarchaeales archaeon]|jgi:tetratricopeptide (TPR) repeat protein